MDHSYLILFRARVNPCKRHISYLQSADVVFEAEISEASDDKLHVSVTVKTYEKRDMIENER